MITFYKITLYSILLFFIALLISIATVLYKGNVVIRINSTTANSFLQNENFILEYDYGELHLGSFNLKPELAITNGVFKQVDSGKILLKIQRGTLSINPLYLLIGKIYISAIKLKDVSINTSISDLLNVNENKSFFESAISLPQSILNIFATAEKSAFINSLQIENSKIILLNDKNIEAITVRVEEFNFSHLESKVISGNGKIAIELNNKSYFIDIETKINTVFNNQFNLRLSSKKINLQDFSTFLPLLEHLNNEGELLLDIRYLNNKVASFELFHKSRNNKITAVIKQTPDEFDDGNLQVLFEVEEFPVIIADEIIMTQFPAVGDMFSLGTKGQLFAKGNLIVNGQFSLLSGKIGFDVPNIKVNSDLFNKPWNLQSIKGKVEILDFKSNRIKIIIDRAINNQGILSATADINNLEYLEIQSTIKIDNFRSEDVVSMIPSFNFENTHSWLRKSLSNGILNNGLITFKLIPSKEIILYNASSEVSNLDVKFINTMSPVKNIAGKIKLDETSLEFEINKGMFDKLNIKQGATVFISYKGNKSFLYTNIKAEGPVSSLFKILNQNPVSFKKQINWSTKNAKGTGVYDLKYSMPIEIVTDVEKINYKAILNLKNFSIPDGPFNLDISTGDIVVNIDSKSRFLSVIGTAIAADSSISFDWRQEGYLQTENISQDVSFTVGLSPNGKRLLNFPIPFNASGYLHGKIHWNQLSNSRISTLNFDVDLTDVDIIAQKYGIVKLAGFPGSLEGKAIKNDKILNVTDGIINIEGAVANISAELNMEKNEFIALDFQSKSFGKHKDFRFTYSNPDNLQIINIKAKELYVVNYIEFLNSSNTSQNQIKHITNLQVDKLFLNEAYYAENAKLVVSNTGIDISYLSFKSEGKDAVSFKISRNKDFKSEANITNNTVIGSYTRKLEINDVGRFFRVFIGQNIFDKGSLVYDYSQKDNLLFGELEIENIKIKSVPIAIRFLEFFSLLGLENAVSGNSFSVLKMIGNIVYDDGKFIVRKGAANAIATSMTFQGEIDYKLKNIDIKGTVSPLYQLSQIFNKVPILDQLLMDPDSGTFLALNYSINGPFEKIELKTNPLLSIVPGLIKRFFKKPDDIPADEGKIIKQ